MGGITGRQKGFGTHPLVLSFRDPGCLCKPRQTLLPNLNAFYDLAVTTDCVECEGVIGFQVPICKIEIW